MGFRVAMEGGKLVMNLGFSHQVIMEVPQGLTVETPSANQIVVSGFDKQLVGQFAANVREKSPPQLLPEPSKPFSREEADTRVTPLVSSMIWA